MHPLRCFFNETSYLKDTLLSARVTSSIKNLRILLKDEMVQKKRRKKKKQSRKDEKERKGSGWLLFSLKNDEKRERIDDFLSRHRIVSDFREAEKKTRYEAHYVRVLVKTRVKE